MLAISGVKTAGAGVMPYLPAMNLKSAMIVSVALLALSNLPIAEAGPQAYKACIAAAGGGPLAAIICLPALAIPGP